MRTRPLGLATTLAVAASAFLCVEALAQDEHVRHAAEQAKTAAGTTMPGDFVFAPIPIVNPTLGVGLTGGDAYLFQIDDGSYPSVIGDQDRHLPLDQEGRAAGVKALLRIHGHWYGGAGCAVPGDAPYYALCKFGVFRGLRCLLSPENRLNIAIDCAVGTDSDAVYFFVGESF
jgi:hypothetical protein